MRARNDPAQYDDLADQWWQPKGAFAALHWLAAARARLLPPLATSAVLIDLGCGGGLMAGRVGGAVHVGLDRNEAALRVAAQHGVRTVQADVMQLPFGTASVDAVVAGEIFEHIGDVERCVREIGRVLRCGGVIVFDTINSTRLAKLFLVTVGEHLPGGPPPRIHDPDLFVAPERLTSLFASQGILVTLNGLRPSARDYVRFLWDRSRPVDMRTTRSLAGVYQGVGRKTSG
jgi:2-polyprenyl-6-hydroxyphenyl methylase/3-demethylubiquinone-9 3-methyltransferase